MVAIDIQNAFWYQAVCGCTKPQAMSNIVSAFLVDACKSSALCVMPCAATGKSGAAHAL